MAAAGDDRGRDRFDRRKSGRYARANSTSSREFSERVERSRSRSSAGGQSSGGTPRGGASSQRRASGGSSSSSRSSTQRSSSSRAGGQSPSRGSSSRPSSRASTRPQSASRGTGRSGRSAQMPSYIHIVENPAERGPVGSSSSRDRSYRDPRSMSGKVSTYSSGSRYEQPDGSPSSVGRRIGDIRAAERSREMRETYRHFVMRIVMVLVIALAIVGAAFAIYWSPLFTITDIEVTGNDFLTTDQVLEIAGVEDGTTLLRVDKNGIEDRLLQNPWVESVHVKRSVPHTLTIEVDERSIDATVDIPVTTQSDTSSTWAIASDGTWLDQLRPDSTDAYDQKVVSASASVVHISDVSITTVPTAGTTCDDAGVNNVLTILSTVSDEFRGQIVSATAPTPARTTFTLSNGVKVAFGTSDDAQAKERVVLQLLAEHSGAISYINVRVVDRPAWRGLESDSADASAAQSTDASTQEQTDTSTDEASTDDTSTDGASTDEAA